MTVMTMMVMIAMTMLMAMYMDIAMLIVHVPLLLRSMQFRSVI